MKTTMTPGELLSRYREFMDLHAEALATDAYELIPWRSLEDHASSVAQYAADLADALKATLEELATSKATEAP